MPTNEIEKSSEEYSSLSAQQQTVPLQLEPCHSPAAQKNLSYQRYKNSEQNLPYSDKKHRGETRGRSDGSVPAEDEGEGLETAGCSDRRETLRLHLPAFRGTFSPVRFPDNYRNSHSSLPKERLAWDGIPRRLPLHFSDGERGEGRSSQAHCFPRDLGYGLLTFEGVWPDSISGISRFGHRHKGEIAGRNRRQEEDYCGSSASGKKHRSRHEASVLRGKLNFVTRIAPWLASVSRDVFAKDPVVSREARATWLEMLDVGSFPMRSPSAALTIMTDASHEAYGIVVKEHASGETREWSVAIQAE
ncbi:hypothetical protein ADUPG1_000254, partial [Aduncisulcus paluster]